MNNSSPLTLIVKAANQKSPDFRIECESNWSIEDLKLHLSKNYPAKPVNIPILSLVK